MKYILIFLCVIGLSGCNMEFTAPETKETQESIDHINNTIQKCKSVGLSYSIKVQTGLKYVSDTSKTVTIFKAEVSCVPVS